MMAYIGPITAAIAEAEPERERLFSRPPRNPAALPKTINVPRMRNELLENACEPKAHWPSTKRTCPA
jgi:hypothetical protein